MNQREHILNAALLAVGVGYVLEPSGDLITFQRIAAISIPIVLGALFPDVDAHYGRHRKALHNLLVLAFFAAFPLYFGNLEWVWLGVLTHYVLDVAGSRRGIALFYPVWKREFGLPLGVPVASSHTGIVTVVITGIEVGFAAGSALYVPTALDAARAMLV